MTSLLASILIIGLSLIPQQVMEKSFTPKDDQEVKLTFFALQPDAGSNVLRLNWATENEGEILHYLIDHSSDGVQYEQVDKVPAFNDEAAVNIYQYKHETPIPSINFYRLSCKYEDGTTTELDIENIIYRLDETVTD